MSHTDFSLSLIDKLAPLRATGGARRTEGLDDETLERFAATHPELVTAVDAAVLEYRGLQRGFADLLELDEDAQVAAVQAGFVNFYPQDGVNPYVALVARGPWVVTLKGAVLYDTGGYGMLGFGHAPQRVLDAMAKPQAMANIMTPSVAQLKVDRALRAEIGHTRGECPYASFMCLNSGSESVSLAARIADIHSKTMTDPGGRYAGRVIKRVVVKGSFHGRTEKPALFSDSSRQTYTDMLASFRGEDTVIAVEPYDSDALAQVFAAAETEGWFIEAMFLEPVMGEGDPGRSVPPEYYAAARALTAEHGSLLLVDSIQAGLRATGTLSIVDYPGFEGQDAPDMETYSKALNAGQYPLSVLALSEHAAAVYRRGAYGNTMTANPRALDVACAVLGLLTPELRRNIQDQGSYAVEQLEKLRTELGGLITQVQGTGLLFSCALDPRFKAYGAGSVEEWLREHGLGVIHGGENSLRFTPRFEAGEDEIDLIVALVGRALAEGPRQAA
ncbi:aminotransferase class III-fold pyridoxal phosphate-dependent enzyme [Pseudactinotalea sp.]|uniref:aminotransferase class III-fold pyridoxal phosphate-dependent enzyme n=1 Tax=Pseudactinotalea sp. TaxID=1926260 RepID=UPI003B3A9CF9